MWALNNKIPFVFTEQTVFEEYAGSVDICSQEEAYEGIDTVPFTPGSGPSPELRRKNPVLSFCKSTVKWIAIIFAIIAFSLVFNVYCIRMNQVNGESMMPTLENHQKIISTRLPYIFGSPSVGDVIVFDTDFSKRRDFFTEISESIKYNVIVMNITGTTDDSVLYVKRVVALAGDEVEFKNNKFFRNGVEVSEDFTLEKNVYTYPAGRKLTVPEGYVYVLGDNRNNSMDSRYIGCVPLESILGVVIM